MNQQAYERGYTHGFYTPVSKYEKSGHNYYQGFVQGVKASRADHSVKVILLSALGANSILRKPNGLQRHPEMNKMWKNAFYASYANRKKPRKTPPKAAKRVEGFPNI